MLEQLSIRNFALIPELDIAFHPGFSVITGETGAGKSIILGAIGLLLGNRADTKAIRPGAQKCVVEAHFSLRNYDMADFFSQNDIDFDPDDCIIRRELSASGKSRGFINDQPVQLQLMRELGQRLIDVHSQHQNLLLQKEDFQLGVLDVMADDGLLLKQYGQAFNDYKTATRRLSDYLADLEKVRANEDYMRFQLQELEGASLDGLSQEELEQQADMLRHAEEIKTALYEASKTLEGDEEGGVADGLRSASNLLEQISKVYHDADSLAQRLDSACIEVRDIADELSAKLDSVDFSPSQLEEVEGKLDTIYSLQQKYHVDTVGSLVETRDKLRQELSSIDNADTMREEYEAQVEESRKQCRQLADKLSAARRAAAKTVEAKMRQLLVQLGMPNSRFQVQVGQKDFSPKGVDQVEFLFSANSSSPLQPVRQVASGGEIARVMLSLKALISGTVKLPTIIFDEIDTGVSGKIAGQMAAIMQRMGDEGRQVISITHLPQIAARGSHHYKVSKAETNDGTVSTMTELTDEERVGELAQMLSGDSVSEAAINNAKELLEQK